MKRLLLVTLLAGCAYDPIVENRQIAGDAIYYDTSPTYGDRVFADAAKLCAPRTPMLISNVPDGWGRASFVYQCQ